MNKLYFGWDYYNYSHQPDISRIIEEKFQDFRPDLTYPNDSDTLPLFNDEYMVTNPWHQLLDVLKDYEVVAHRDTTELIERDIPFIYLIGIRSGPQEWETDDRNKLFHNIKQHTKNYIKDGKVLVIVDMSGEGYPVENLDELTFSETGVIPNIPIEIEKAADREDFPLTNMCYLTGNAEAVNYEPTKINIINLCWSEIAVKKSNNEVDNIFEEVFEYKKKHVRRPTTKHFLSLCKLVKDWRLYHSLGLNHYNLHEKGLTSLIIPKNQLMILNERLWPGAAAKRYDSRIDDSSDETDFVFNENITEFEEYIRVIKLKLRLIGNTEHGKYVKSDENIKSLLEKLPLYVDLKSFKQNDGTPISGFSVWDESFYNDTFFSYLYESYAYNTKTTYISEKFWKTVLNFHPTLLVTNPHTLRYLRDRGYKTFSPFIDESYDNEEDFDLRTNMLLSEVNRLCEMSKTEMLDWYSKQSDTLIYNFKKYYEDDIIIKPINKIKELYNIL